MARRVGRSACPRSSVGGSDRCPGHAVLPNKLATYNLHKDIQRPRELTDDKTRLAKAHQRQENCPEIQRVRVHRRKGYLRAREGALDARGPDAAAGNAQVECFRIIRHHPGQLHRTLLHASHAYCSRSCRFDALLCTYLVSSLRN